MTTPPGNGRELRVGAVVQLGAVTSPDVTVHGVVAARAPWSVHTLLVVPADLMPLAGAHDLFLAGSAPAGPHEQPVGGLWLRGLTTFAVDEKAWATRAIEGYVADAEIERIGAFLRDLDLRRPDAACDPDRTALGLTLSDWVGRVAELADPKATSPGLRARIRSSPRETTLLRAVRSQDRPVALAADAPRRLERSFGLHATDGRRIQVARDPQRGRVLVSTIPYDDIVSVIVGGRKAACTPAGFEVEGDRDAEICVTANNRVAYRGRLEFQ